MKLMIHAGTFVEYSSLLVKALVAHGQSLEVHLTVDNSVIERTRRLNSKSVEGWVGNYDQIQNLGVHLRDVRGRQTSLVSVLAVYKLLVSNGNTQIDVLHLQSPHDPRFILPSLKVQTVLTLHEPSLRKGAKFTTPIVKRTISRLTSFILRKISDLIIVHTMTCFEMLSAKERQKARVIPHGICESYIPVALEETKCILFFGRADEYKGIDLLLMAMEEVWKFDETIQLRILASRGNYKFPGDLDTRITVTEDGYTEEELDSAISDSYVICIPYVSVSGSAVAARAAGSGRPIVASDLIGLSELVDDDELRFISGDAKDLARSLKVALSKEPHVVPVNKMRKWNEVANAHIALYESLCERLR